MERKMKILKIVNMQFQGYTDKEIREKLEIPKRTYFRWKHRIDEEGLHNVINKRLPGRKPSYEINNEIRRKIIDWRKRYGWGPARIEGHLKAHDNIHVPHNQIYKIFVKNKLNRPIEQPRKYWGKGRYETI
jgi:transposase